MTTPCWRSRYKTYNFKIFVDLNAQDVQRLTEFCFYSRIQQRNLCANSHETLRRPAKGQSHYLYLHFYGTAGYYESVLKKHTVHRSNYQLLPTETDAAYGEDGATSVTQGLRGRVLLAALMISRFFFCCFQICFYSYIGQYCQLSHVALLAYITSMQGKTAIRRETMGSFFGELFNSLCNTSVILWPTDRAVA